MTILFDLGTFIHETSSVEYFREPPEYWYALRTMYNVLAFVFYTINDFDNVLASQISKIISCYE